MGSAGSRFDQGLASMWEASRAVRERDSAVLVLKGEAWYLRKQIGGKRQDHALKIYGGEPNLHRQEDESAAQ